MSSPRTTKVTLETDPNLMRTILRIPYAKAIDENVDPSWMSKKKAGRKLNPIEADQYF